ncbi:MAG: hypothetical protein A3J83_09260 [Elusimicrobia bacterium RIFOXYA2_FULL_40_6]|nr:MAG: hypothetical protein A3J83_09260 [Elusimicrobia bacterium RIFOXYA2_FULL_40_6]
MANSATSIQWSWTDNATNETGYALKDGNGVHISSLAANAVTHSEQNLNPNTAYTRYLVAYNSASESTSISTVVYTLVNAPTGLKITNYTDTSISLAWSPGAGGNTRYGISRSTTGTASADFSSLKAWGDNISTTYYTDTPLEAGVTYYYKVFGYNGEQTATDFTDTVYQMPIKINEPVLPVSRTSEVIVGNGSGNLTITLSTGVFTGVDKYYLKVSTLPISNPVHVSTITLNQANTVLALNAALKLVPNSIVEIVAYDYNHNVEITTGAADIMLTIPYADSDNDGFVDGITDVKETDLKIYTLNINSQLWELQPGVLTDDTANNTVTIKIPHFSCYALIGSTSSAAGVIRRFNTTEPIVYPNPFMPVSGNQYSAAGITFDNLPATEEVTIKIYTISGDFVNKFTKAVTEGQKKVWDGKNNSGEQVSSGIYVYYIKSDSINKKGRLAIIK